MTAQIVTPMRKKLKLIRPRAPKTFDMAKGPPYFGMDTAKLEKRVARHFDKGDGYRGYVKATDLSEVHQDYPYGERDKRLAKGEQVYLVAFRVKGCRRKMITAVWAKTPGIAGAKIRHNHIGKGGHNAVSIQGVRPYTEVKAIERLSGRAMTKDERLKYVITGEYVPEAEPVAFDFEGHQYWVNPITTGRTYSTLPNYSVADVAQMAKARGIPATLLNKVP